MRSKPYEEPDSKETCPDGVITIRSTPSDQSEPRIQQGLGSAIWVDLLSVLFDSQCCRFITFTSIHLYRINNRKWCEMEKADDHAISSAILVLHKLSRTCY